MHHALQNKQTAGFLSAHVYAGFEPRGGHREEVTERRSPRGAHFGWTFLEWPYEDDNVRVRAEADSYLIGNGKIVAQTIHYTVEQK